MKPTRPRPPKSKIYDAIGSLDVTRDTVSMTGGLSVPHWVYTGAIVAACMALVAVASWLVYSKVMERGYIVVTPAPTEAPEWVPSPSDWIPGVPAERKWSVDVAVFTVLGLALAVLVVLGVFAIVKGSHRSVLWYFRSRSQDVNDEVERLRGLAPGAMDEEISGVLNGVERGARDRDIATRIRAIARVVGPKKAKDLLGGLKLGLRRRMLGLAGKRQQTALLENTGATNKIIEYIDAAIKDTGTQEGARDQRLPSHD